MAKISNSLVKVGFLVSLGLVLAVFSFTWQNLQTKTAVAQGFLEARTTHVVVINETLRSADGTAVPILAEVYVSIEGFFDDKDPKSVSLLQRRHWMDVWTRIDIRNAANQLTDAHFENAQEAWQRSLLLFDGLDARAKNYVTQIKVQEIPAQSKATLHPKMILEKGFL